MEIHSKQEERRRSIFARMSELAGVDARGLTELPVSETERLFAEVSGVVEFDRVKLRQRLLEHAGLA